MDQLGVAAAVMVAAVASLLAPTAAAEGFATVEPPAYLDFQPPSTIVNGSVRFEPGSWTAGAAHVLFGVHPRASSLHATVVGVADEHGTPLRAPKSNSTPDDSSRSFPISSLPRDGGPVRVLARIEADHNGRFPLGFLVIAFDDEWNAVTLEDGSAASRYAEATVGVYGIQGDPPFVGRGNVPDVAFAAVAIGIGLAAWARGAYAGRRS